MSVPFDVLALPFDWPQRYWAIAEIADAVRSGLCQSPLTVLDVGGYLRTRRRFPSLESLRELLSKYELAFFEFSDEYLSR